MNSDRSRGEPKERLDAFFKEIAAEPPARRAARWQGSFDRVAFPLEGKLVLFGAGQFGQLALERLRLAGVEPCCFSDNNRARWGQDIDGLEVLSPAAAVEHFSQTATFVVTIFNGSSARMQLTQMGCRRVLHAALLFWKYPRQFMPDLGIDTPEIIVEQEDQIRQCFALLADEKSQHELCDQISWRYWLEPSFLPMPSNSGEIYFPSDIARNIDEEIFVDCGAYDGDSIRAFLRGRRTFHHLYALEPDAGNRALLSTAAETLPEGIRQKVTVWPYAVGNLDGKMSFAAGGGVASKISTSATGLSLEARRLDSLDWEFTPTYIKMDIEGSEPEALAGGAELLRHAQPVLAICLYHRLEHLWQIPNLIHSLAPGYCLFVRRYAEDCWEQVCYAVPRNRLVESAGVETQDNRLYRYRNTEQPPKRHTEDPMAKDELVIPPEVEKIAVESIGTFFEPISGIEKHAVVKDFLDTSKAYKRAEILQRYTPIHSKKLLEVGSGFGTSLALWIKCFGVDGYGIEPGSEGFSAGLHASREVFSANGIDSNRLFDGTGEHLPFPDESFDIVYSAHTLEHTQDPAAVLRESIRVLRKGGILHMEFPNHLSYFEGHYLTLQPPLVFRWILPLWVRLVLRRDPAFAKSLQTQINPIWCRRVLKEIAIMYPVRVISLGEDLFLERLSQAFRFETDMVAGRLSRIMSWVQRVNRANWVGHSIVGLQGHFPIYLTVQKL